MEAINNKKLYAIAQSLMEQPSILIFSHKNPDGDAIGSAVCAGLALKSLGKKVSYAIEKDTAGLYSLFAEGDCFGEEIGGSYSAALVLDCSTSDFIANESLLGKCGRVIVLDHHLSNGGYGDEAYIDSNAAATGEILYDLIKLLGAPLSTESANALFLSLSSDTGYFRYSNTTAKTHMIMAELYGYSSSFSAISEYADSYTLDRLMLTKTAIDSLEFFYGGKLGILSLTKENDLLQTSDTEGIIDIVRNVKGCVFSAFIKQVGDSEYKVSMRSAIDSLDISTIAKKFGGGGHQRSAGFNMQAGSIAQVKQAIIGTLEGIWTE
ncbi:MAG: bifunctional oligoribonuclease/PAP phosphatase NrnA [Eubacteriaceae bacterium]|nr:bifunctional oligoribonuclease/PAP phosphatase NrnA [Eubacteriaceae bacterium]